MWFELVGNGGSNDYYLHMHYYNVIGGDVTLTPYYAFNDTWWEEKVGFNPLYELVGGRKRSGNYEEVIPSP
ncbi:MAG: hypothetical protein HC822_10380 [Oscillochloris sp.]|nr:hypothetical protein [Oscillochloris sp.]